MFRTDNHGITVKKEIRINIPLYNDYGKAIGKWMDYESAKFDVRIVAGTTMPVNRWALLEEYFRWFQAGLIDDVAMIAETDIRGKQKVLERKAMYSQLQSQVEQLSEAIKDKDGTIQSLSRQLVNSGIKEEQMKGSMQTEKEVLDTKAQQKLLRGMMKEEFKNARAQLLNDVRQAADDVRKT